MKHRVKVDVVTERRGLFGKRPVVEHKTVTVDGRTYRKMKREERDRQRAQGDAMAAAAMILFEEEMAERFGE